MDKKDIGSRVRVIAVDVRGTLIDPYDDIEIDLELAGSLWQFVSDGGHIGVITATSIKSLQTLMIPQLMSSISISALNSDLLDRLVFYVDSGTAAYRLNADGNPVAIEGFPFISFSQTQVDAIIDVIRLTRQKFIWPNAVWKVKAGQVNYYCG